MTTRGEINSNFYQIVNVDANGAPTEVKPEYLPNVGNANTANCANYAGNAFSVDISNVVGIGNIATINLDGNGANVLYGNGIFDSIPNAAYANYANYAGQVVDNAQPNITSTGTLTSLTVSGNTDLGNVGNITITGGTLGYFLQTDGAGNLGWAAGGGGGNGVPGGINTYVQFNDGGTFGGNINFTYDVSTNVLTVGNIAGNITTPAQGNITSVGTLISLDVTGNITGNALQLNTGTGVTVANIGAMFWDEASNTVTLGMNNGVQQQIGLESYILVKASATITDGQVVMFTGAAGNHVTAAPADTTSVGFRPEYIIGVATQNIATNDFGYITVFGIVHGLNTNSFNVGDILWVDNTTPGGLTVTRPSDPNFQIEVAAVTKKSAGDGHLQVRVTAFTDINSLTDVTTTTPSAGQALIYTSSNTWVNGFPNYANIANSVNGFNVSGTVANANYSLYSGNTQVNFGLSLGNNYIPFIDSSGTGQKQLRGEITLIYDSTNNKIYTGNADLGNAATANYFVGNGSLLTGITATNANYANFAGNVVNASQSNITSLGTLVSLTVTGNITSGNADLGNLVTANYFTGNGSLLTSITGANVTGTVANATNATTAGTVTSNAQPNITSTGTLISLTVTGNLSTGNISSTGLGNVANVVFTKFNENVISGGNTSTSISPNVANGTIFTYTANANFTMSTLTSAVAGSSATVIITQDATGNRLLTSTMKFAGASKTLSTAANTTDIICVFYDGSTYYATLSKGYA